MNASVKSSKLYKICYCFMSTNAKQRKQPQWLKPDGYETNITMYNPITKRNVPLILKNKNLLTWYVCGPTVYDSTHIGHASTYVKTDIIRRILSDHFNINIIMAMCITNIDDKIINRAQETKQNYKDLTQHYENEFFEDMKILNVTKPHLYYRVTDFIPEIIKFISNIVNKGDAYVTQDGSVNFNSNKCNTYGKLRPPKLNNSSHLNKISSADFCLWKAAKENTLFWESPWGNGRPGWHIECSTIASTIFGNSVDIHSGGIDLAFPHHENEEAQSCSYHEVDQWVNYWLHCGHVCLDDVKMSKSLKNTISIREFLKTCTANQFRMLCLLSNYKNEIKISDNESLMTNPVNILNKVEHFISNCNNYAAGRLSIGNVDEVTLLRSLDETKNNVNIALATDFNTVKAVHLIINLIDTVNNMLHNCHESLRYRSIPPILAVSNYVSTIFSMFGISHCEVADEYRMNNIIEDFIKFRSTVRNRVLQDDVKDKSLLTACDEIRSNLSARGIIIKDKKGETSWSIKKY